MCSKTPSTKHVRRITSLAVVAVFLACERSNVMPPHEQTPFDIGDLQIEVVKSNPSVTPIFSESEETYLGRIDNAGRLSPREAFERLREREAAKDDETPDSGVLYLAGRIKGEVYSIDTFKVEHVERDEGHVTFTVTYNRVESQNLEPAPSKAYFKLEMQQLVDHITIAFNQRFKGVNNEQAIEEPPLSDVSVEIRSITDKSKK